MVPWNAVPWDTVAIIIGLSLIIPSLATILFIKRRRFEEFGMFLGLFLVILSLISYFVIIPTQVIQQADLPENYRWEDQGSLYYWERNSVFPNKEVDAYTPLELERLFNNRDPIEMNITATEIIHAVQYHPETGELLIHDAFYDEDGEVFQVINDQEEISEWYTINPHLTDLSYTKVDAGRMGLPMNYDQGSRFIMGWVESDGQQNGSENVVLIREMQRIQTGTIDGITVEVWQSDVFNQPITWHGEEYICDETLRLTVNPETGYVVHVYRHLVLSAHMSQFLKIYYPERYDMRIIQKYLERTDPIGEAAELIYESTDDSVTAHLDNVRALHTQMTIIPLLVCIPLFLIGFLLCWRYWGRSYYWKRYHKYERNEYHPSVYDEPYTRSPRRTILVVSLVIIIIMASVGSTWVYINHQGETTIEYEDNNPLEFKENDPTPPGNTRLIDSGRHTLEPIDEGVHKFSRREWWYYNVFFNDPSSDLYGWSMIVSFNSMAFNDIRYLKPDNLFIILYDDEGNSYNLGVLDQPRNTMTMGGPGVDVTFGNSYARGQYPHWDVYAENPVEQFRVELSFEADFMPVWVMGRSTNLVLFRYFGGDYYIPRCHTNGTIHWKGETYQVKGTGYHDHVWQTTAPRWATKGWDWMNLHFDNGWEMYISKFIFRTPRDLYAGALVMSPGNENIVEYNIYQLEVTETATPEGMPLMKYPKKYHLRAKRDDMLLELDIDIYNTHELTWRYARTGMFEGPCTATGSFSWNGNTVDLNGYGMSEITRVKYLLELPGILPRREPLFYRLLNR